MSLVIENNMKLYVQILIEQQPPRSAARSKLMTHHYQRDNNQL